MTLHLDEKQANHNAAATWQHPAVKVSHHGIVLQTCDGVADDGYGWCCTLESGIVMVKSGVQPTTGCSKQTAVEQQHDGQRNKADGGGSVVICM